MTASYAALRAMSDEELVGSHDAIAQKYRWGS
jgi:hypothetical protein